MIKFKQTQYSEDNRVFLDYIGKLEGFKTKCKNLHWAAPKKNIHTYLDDFLGIVSDYQDTVAEGYMGILGKMGPNDVEAVPAAASDAVSFIDEVLDAATDFYESIPSDTVYKGLSSETETFIQEINKYKYLFSLCDNNYSN
jgi:DNA-binding ferritin-like protein